MLTEQELRNQIPKLESVAKSFKNANDNLDYLKNVRFSLSGDIKTSFYEYLNKVIRNETGSGFRNNDTYSSFSLSFNHGNFDSKTVAKTYDLLEYEKMENEILKYYGLYYSRVDDSLTDIKPLLRNGLMWLLTGREKKDKSINAANYLLDLINSGYLDNISHLNNRYTSIDRNQAYSEFCNSEGIFDAMISKVTGVNVYTDIDPIKPDFNALSIDESTIKSAYSNLHTCIEKTDNLKNKIVKEANVMLDAEIKNALKEIPIEEINKNKSGIKVNTLKNAGVSTVYDAYSSSPWELSSIRGISEDAGYIITEKAREIRNGVASNIKLKFNVDKKTSEATKLLNSIHTYTQNKEIINELDKLNNDCFSKVMTIISNISGYDNPYGWYKGDYKRKKLVSDSAHLLKNVISSDYLEHANNLKRRFSLAESSLSDSQIWEYYSNNSAKCYSELDELCPGLFGNSDTYFGLPEELAKKIEDECIFPDGLLVTLRRYQEWGVKYILHQEKVLLGDEMGLGKTIQSIAAMVSLKNIGASHFVVVCPASVVINWCREIETHSKLKAIKVHGNGKKSAFNQWLKQGGVAVTTYETTSIFKFEDDYKFDMATIDEAHYCKNPDAMRTQNVVNLCEHTDRILYMTGTALENKVDEMIELISHLRPALAREVSHYSYMQASDTFKEKVAPVYYRRKREDVLTELPELTISKEWCQLTSEELDRYKKTLASRNYPAVRKISWNIDDLHNSSKANRLKEIIEDAKDDGRRVIVFSFFLETISKIREFLGPICTQPINGSVSPARRQEIIDRFNESEAGSVLLAQIQAGGTGLNIQSASVIVLCEPQFKPSVENQAISRAYRMGQTRNVLVYRLLSENSVDEKLMDILEEKQAIFDAFADESIAAQAEKVEVDEKTFGNIIQEEIDRLKVEKEEQ